MQTITQINTDDVRERANAVRTTVRQFRDVRRLDADGLAKDVLHLADEVDALRAKLARLDDQ